MVKSLLKTAYFCRLYGDVYFYIFSYLGGLTKRKPINLTGIGKTAHFDDIFYVFKNAYFHIQYYPDKDVEISKTLVGFFTNFIMSLYVKVFYKDFK